MVWWYIGVFGVLAIVLVIAGTMRIARRRRQAMGYAHVYPVAREHPAEQRHAPRPTERGASGGAFRGAGLGATLKGLFRGGATDATWSELEALLVKADLGPKAAADLVARVRDDHAGAGDVVRKVRAEILEILGTDEPLALDGDLSVILIVGV